MKNKFLYCLLAGSLYLTGCGPKTEEPVEVKVEVNHLLVGSDYLLKSEFNKSIEEFNIHLKKDSLSSVAYYNKGIALEMLGNYQNAIESYTSAITLDPNFTMAYYKRGVSKKMSGNNEGSVEDLKKAVDLKPDFIVAIIEIAHIQSASKKIEKNIVEMLTNSISKKADSDMLYQNRGVYQYYLGDNKSALADFDLAIQYNPSNIEALYHSGIIYGEMNDYVKSVERLTKVIELDKMYKSAYVYRGVYNYNNGKNDIACVDFMKAKELGESTVQKFIDSYCSKK